ncbi:EamA family transporter [uncultured Ilyobacter sp.]|uniref:DMT family transporter n=1 Tax=uncultured Ilyobacter sp. TaxID=544433 RepID=UPI0029C77F63|nr:EamA family transporter [uncultured Ilyobacter sp.]
MDFIENSKGYILVFLAAFFWGTLGILVKYMENKGFAVYDIAFLRSFFGLSILSIFIFFRDRKKTVIDKKGFISCSLIGLINQGFFNIFYFSAIIKTGMTTGVILLYTAPSFALIFSRILLGDRFTKEKFLAMIMAFTGCFFVVTGGSFSEVRIDTLGVFMGIAAGATYGILPVFNKKVFDKYHFLTIMFYSFLSGTITLSFFADLTRIIEIFKINNFTIFMGVLLGFFPTLVSHLCFLNATRYIEAFKISITANFEVIIVAVTAYLIYGEKLSKTKFLGMVLVMGATVIPQILNKIKVHSDMHITNKNKH